MCLLAESVGQILGSAAMTSVIGIVVVFAVLLLLTGIIKVFGMIASRAESEEVTQVAPVVAPVAAAIVGNTQEVSSSMELDNEIAPEMVAVISAAVASMAPAGTQYAVADIRKL